MGCKPSFAIFEEGLEKPVDWYLHNSECVNHVTLLENTLIITNINTIKVSMKYSIKIVVSILLFCWINNYKAQFVYQQLPTTTLQKIDTRSDNAVSTNDATITKPTTRQQQYAYRTEL